MSIGNNSAIRIAQCQPPISPQPNLRRTTLNDTTYAVGVLAFGRAVLYLLSFFVFALAERKNEKHWIRKYHAAAGGIWFNAGHRVSPKND
jgi:hypothetical protein